MILLPFEDFYIVTRFDPEEVRKKLSREIKRGTWSLNNIFASPGTYFRGDISGNAFNCKRDVIYNNSSMPQIEGHIAPYRGGSLVHVKMRMLIITIIVTSAWISIFGVVGIVVVADAVGSDTVDIVSFFPLGIMLLVYGIILAAFKFESLRAKAKLLELLEGEIEKIKA